MKISEIINETSSSGSTGAGSIATNISNGKLKDGQFFGGDPSSSIYATIKKHRENRKNKHEKEK